MGVTRTVRFWLLIVAAGLALVSGLIGIGYAVHRWTAAPLQCHYAGAPPLNGFRIPCHMVLVHRWWELPAWAAFGLGLGALAVGACLLLLARRIEPERSARLAIG